MAKSLNRVQLIGNLTRDPELRYTPAGTAVCSFGIATNRTWTTDTGEKRDEADFHKIIAWNKLAELCGQYLVKGRKVFVEGRLSTRNWNAADGTQRTTTEVIISDMILLDSAGNRSASSSKEEPEMQESEDSAEQSIAEEEPKVAKKETKKSKKTEESEEKVEPSSDEVAPDDIPF